MKFGCLSVLLAVMLHSSALGADLFVGVVLAKTPIGMVKSKTFVSTENGVSLEECEEVIRIWGDGQITDADLTVAGVLYNTFTTECRPLGK